MLCYLVRYNSLGQLLCVICNQQVKSNILWTSHLKSRRHKDSVASLKASQKGAAPPVTSCPPSEVVATPSPTSRSNGSPPGKVRVHEEASVAGGASARKRNLEEEVREELICLVIFIMVGLWCKWSRTC